MSAPSASEQKPASMCGGSKGSADRSVMLPRDFGRTTSSCGGCTMAVLSAGSFEVTGRHGAMCWPQQRSRVHVLELQEH